MVIGYVARSPLALISLEDPVSQEMCGVLNIFSTTIPANFEPHNARIPTLNSTTSQETFEAPETRTMEPITEPSKYWKDSRDFSGIKIKLMRGRVVKTLKRYAHMYTDTLGRIKAT